MNLIQVVTNLQPLRSHGLTGLGIHWGSPLNPKRLTRGRQWKEDEGSGTGAVKVTVQSPKIASRSTGEKEEHEGWRNALSKVSKDNRKIPLHIPS